MQEKETKEVYSAEEVRMLLEKTGTLFGIEVVIAPDVDDKSYINGYRAGMKDAKEQMLKALTPTDIKTDK